MQRFEGTDTYVATQDLQVAVNAAIALERPLLIKGEPGTGKTILAHEVAKALEAKFGEPRKAALTWKPQNTVSVDDETGEKLLKLMDLLNEHDDVQNVYANFEVSDALVARLGG